MFHSTCSVGCTQSFNKCRQCHVSTAGPGCSSVAIELTRGLIGDVLLPTSWKCMQLLVYGESERFAREPFEIGWIYFCYLPLWLHQTSWWWEGTWDFQASHPGAYQTNLELANSFLPIKKELKLRGPSSDHPTPNFQQMELK